MYVWGRGGWGEYCFNVVLPSVRPSIRNTSNLETRSMKLGEYVYFRKIGIHVFRISPFLYLAPYFRIVSLLSSQKKKQFVIATPPRPGEGFS